MGRRRRVGIPEGGARSVVMLECYWLTGRDVVGEFAEQRKALMARAAGGDEDALAYLRDELGLRTWIANGKKLIVDGVLVGAVKEASCFQR
jgi:hypothetical protein